LLITCLAGWIPSHAVISVASEFPGHPIFGACLALWRVGGWSPPPTRREPPHCVKP
jgi:hypothetical protein